MPKNILLVGLPDATDACKIIEGCIGENRIFFFADTLEAARELLLSQKISFFFLDTHFGISSIYDFYQWMLNHKPILFAYIGDVEQYDFFLAIDSLNSGLCVDYILRPMNTERCESVFAHYGYWSNYGPGYLASLKGKQISTQRWNRQNHNSVVCDLKKEKEEV